MRRLDHAVGFLVAAAALGAGPDRFVVGDDRRAGHVILEQVRVDRADPADQAVGRRDHPQFFPRPLAPLRCDTERHVLVPGPALDELGDVLARGPLALGVALRDRAGPVVIEQRLVQVDVVLQVGSDVIEINVTRAAVDGRTNVGRLDEHERMALPDDVADRDGDLLHDSADIGLEHVLHLHRVHDDHVLAGHDAVAFANEDLDDRALDRSAQRLGARRTDDLGRGEAGTVFL